MSSTTRPTAIGMFFLLLGLALVALGVAPVIVALLQHPPTHADPSWWLLGVGIALAVYGALQIPYSGAKPALQVIVSVAGPYLPSFPKFGGKRAGDPPAPGGTP